jgi:tetratricopeptide (TPR) repeat protein
MINLYKILTICLLVVLSSFTQPDAKSYYNTGIQSLNSKDYIEAIGAFTNAISLKPDFADAYFYRAYAKDLLGKKMGFTSTELCGDLITALRLGKTEAAEKLEKSCMGECFNVANAFQEPESVFCADFSSKNLKDLPAGSEKLKSLVRLNCMDNQLGTVTARMSSMTTLVSLDLSANDIKVIPDNIGKLQHLRELNLNKNQITSLPIEFGNLKHLTILTFRQNQLKEMPKSIAQLTSLETLDLAFNQITTLPIEIANLKRLRTLTLVGNDISEKEQQKIKALLPGTTVYFE